MVLDPFCGSGTTCVSAKPLKRNFIGIDISKEAVELANSRLDEMVITESALLNKGADEYLEKSERNLQFLRKTQNRTRRFVKQWDTSTTLSNRIVVNFGNAGLLCNNGSAMIHNLVE